MKEMAGVSALILILSAVAGLFCPWWWAIVPIGGVISFFCSSSGWRAFFSGAAGVGLLWLGWSAFIHWQSGALLSGKIAQICHVPFPLLLVFLTVLIGALTTGCACSTGFHLRALLPENLGVRGLFKRSVASHDDH